MRRKRKAFRVEPVPLGDVIPGVLKGLRPKRGKLDRVRKAWVQVVGELIAKRTHLATLEGGVLTIIVASAALKHDLVTFRQDAVLKGLSEHAPEAAVTALKCRVGTVP